MAGKSPRKVIIDKLADYLDGIELAFGADTKHVQSKPFTVENSTNLIERFHGTLKARTKVMRGLKRVDTAKLFAEGWLVHYNFFRPHEALKNKTPAEVAGIKFPFRNWKDIVRDPKLVVRPVEVTEKPIKLPMHKPSSRVSRGFVSPKAKRKRKPRGDIYVGHGMISRRPFTGSKAKRGRII